MNDFERYYNALINLRFDLKEVAGFYALREYQRWMGRHALRLKTRALVKFDRTICGDTRHDQRSI